MGRWIRRIGLGLLAGLGLLLTLLVVSVVVDGLVGSGRVAALTNTAIPTAAGRDLRAYVAAPEGPGPFPAVIMIHEWWGLQPELIGKAEAMAAEGYVVVAPDTYRGASTGWIPRALYQSIRTPQARVDEDLDEVHAWLAAQPGVDPARIAIMGFCYGGRVSLRYSLHNDRLAATALFYGSPVTEPTALARLPGPVLGVFGGADSSIPLAEVRAFEEGLAAVGVPHRVTIYEGQGHAFVGSIEEIRQGGAAGEAWAELLAFLDGALRP